MNNKLRKLKLQIPEFWKANVHLWIALYNNAFIYSEITNDEMKFSALIANVDAEILSQVREIVLNPLESEKYKNTRLICEWRFWASED